MSDDENYIKSLKNIQNPMQFLRKYFMRSIFCPHSLELEKDEQKDIYVVFKTIYYPFWWINDLAIVIFHMLFTVFLTFPSISVWFYMEMIKENYAISDSRYLIRQDMMKYDFFKIFGYFHNFNEIGIAFLIVSSIFICINFIQEVILYYYSVFPET